MPQLWIPGPLPGLNEHIAATNRNRYAGNSLKSKWTKRVMFAACEAKLDGMMLSPVIISFKWVERNMRRDPDNIRFAAKYACDGLVHARVIPGDGWKHILGFQDTWEVGPWPGVMVTITPTLPDQIAQPRGCNEAERANP